MVWRTRYHDDSGVRVWIRNPLLIHLRGLESHLRACEGKMPKKSIFAILAIVISMNISLVIVLPYIQHFRHASALIGLLLLVELISVVTVFFHGFAMGFSSYAVDYILRSGLCPQCLYPLASLPGQTEGWVVCSECSGKWLATRIGGR